MNSVVPQAPSGQDVALRRQAKAVKQAWNQGTAPDAQAALTSHPDLAGDKCCVLDLAYEEYVLRWQAGQPPDVEAFCSRFPAFRSSLRQMLQMHHYVDENAHAVDQVAALEDWPAPGAQLGDLILLRDLGRGAFARVYLAAETSVGGRAVAVKLSLEGGSEAHTLGRLVHPNVVPVLSARVDVAGWTEVRMPFLGGATLHDLLDHAYPAGPGSAPPASAVVILSAARSGLRSSDPELPALPSSPHLQGSYVDGVTWLGAQLADALAFLHGNKVLHRDLKPSNILLDATGRPLLLDFKLSADARRAAPRLGGTLPYMAPEQVCLLLPKNPHHAAPLPDAAQSGASADVFSLGVLLYQLLTSELPFGSMPATTPVEVQVVELRARQQLGYRPLRDHNPAVPRGLARVIESCLAQDPDRRPADAAALASALRRHFSLAARLRRWATQHRRRVIALAAILVFTCVAGTALLRALAPVPEARYVVQYRQGRIAYNQGDYAAARGHFKRALEDHPDDYPSQFGHARSQLMLSRGAMDLGDARGFFAAINNDRKDIDGPAKACEAYCYARMGSYPQSLMALDEAEKAGFREAALYNNRAVALIKSQDADKFTLAQEALNKALMLDEGLVQARYNRALLVRDCCLMAPKIPPIPQTILEDVDRLEQEQPGADVHYLAASLHAFASGQADEPARQREQKRAFDSFQKALMAKFDPKELKTHLTRANLNTEPAFARLIEDHPRQKNSKFDGPVLTYQLVDPAPRLPD